MDDIRPLRRDDLPSVAALLERRFPPSPYERPGSLSTFLVEALFEQPWADASMPSLVATAGDGRVIGFIASHVRRVAAAGTELKAVCCSHLAVDGDHAAAAVGVRLLSKLMTGPQDLTYSDTANALVARGWTLAGGRIDHLRSMFWMRVLRPGTWALRLAARRVAAREPRRLSPIWPVPLEMLGARASAPAGAACAGIDDRALLEELSSDPQAVVQVAYDAEYLRWTLAMLEARFGARRVVRRAVLRGGRRIGSFVFVTEPNGRTTVLQVTAHPRQADAVIDALFAAARDLRTVVLVGRLEPHLVEPLRRRRCAVGFGGRATSHARNRELLSLLDSDRSLLGWLDGEWWAISTLTGA